MTDLLLKILSCFSNNYICESTGKVSSQTVSQRAQGGKSIVAAEIMTSEKGFAKLNHHAEKKPSNSNKMITIHSIQADVRMHKAQRSTYGWHK